MQEGENDDDNVVYREKVMIKGNIINMKNMLQDNKKSDVSVKRRKKWNVNNKNKGKIKIDVIVNMHKHL